MTTPHDTHTLREGLVEEFEHKIMSVDEKGHQAHIGDAYGATQWLRTALTTLEAAAREEELRNVKLDGFEIEEIVQETVGKMYQDRFNQHLDYDQWQGIRAEMRECARHIAKKINERVELNHQALTPTDYPANTHTDVTKN